MDWVATAEEFCGSYGWGARGKYIGVSRMFSDNDKSALTRTKMVASRRPRGILSGFFAIVPALGYAVYLPPIAAKMGPLRIRMRVSEELLRDGAVFSAYVTRGSGQEVVLEDVLVWKNKSVWFTTSFDERWNGLMNRFVTQEWTHDPVLQTIPMRLSEYTAIEHIEEPDDGTVIEFVPNAPNQKRLIWIPAKEAAAPITSGAAALAALRETSMGPDVYSVWRGEERLGIALVRTLAVSKALRTAPAAEKIPVHGTWNKQFEKWEILGTV